MSRYIKFDDAVKVMACEMYAEAQSQGYDVDGIEDFMPEAKAWLNDAPSIELEPKRGEWIIHSNGKMCDCSACNESYDRTFEYVDEWNFCPNCGCRMKGADDE